MNEPWAEIARLRESCPRLKSMEFVGHLDSQLFDHRPDDAEGLMIKIWSAILQGGPAHLKRLSFLTFPMIQLANRSENSNEFIAEALKELRKFELYNCTETMQNSEPFLHLIAGLTPSLESLTLFGKGRRTGIDRFLSFSYGLPNLTSLHLVLESHDMGELAGYACLVGKSLRHLIMKCKQPTTAVHNSLSRLPMITDPVDEALKIEDARRLAIACPNLTSFSVETDIFLYDWASGSTVFNIVTVL